MLQKRGNDLPEETMVSHTLEVAFGGQDLPCFQGFCHVDTLSFVLKEGLKMFPSARWNSCTGSPCWTIIRVCGVHIKATSRGHWIEGTARGSHCVICRSEIDVVVLWGGASEPDMGRGNSWLND